MQTLKKIKKQSHEIGCLHHKSFDPGSQRAPPTLGTGSARTRRTPRSAPSERRREPPTLTQRRSPATRRPQYPRLENKKTTRKTPSRMIQLLRCLLPEGEKRTTFRFHRRHKLPATLPISRNPPIEWESRVVVLSLLTRPLHCCRATRRTTGRCCHRHRRNKTNRDQTLRSPVAAGTAADPDPETKRSR